MNLPQEANTEEYTIKWKVNPVAEKAYVAGVAAERDRLRQLAIDNDAVYGRWIKSADGLSRHQDLPFADLIGDDTP